MKKKKQTPSLRISNRLALNAKCAIPYIIEMGERWSQLIFHLMRPKFKLTIILRKRRKML